jgi:hypothetical protein
VSKAVIITIDQIVFVHVDENGRPKAHGITEETLPEEESSMQNG